MTDRLCERDAGMGVSHSGRTVCLLFTTFHKRRKHNHADRAQHTRTSAMQSRVARGCGVALGLRRCHICSSVHGTCKRMHMNILRSPIGFWFSPPLLKTSFNDFNFRDSFIILKKMFYLLNAPNVLLCLRSLVLCENYDS